MIDMNMSLMLGVGVAATCQAWVFDQLTRQMAEMARY